MSLSEFYLACRTGDLGTIQRLLPTLSLDALNRIEPNGSTALHAACHYGHIDVVRLLLEKGAQRRLLNKFNLIPVDEAQSREMKQLFDRPTTAATQRFVGETPQVEWSKAGLHSAYTAFGNWDNPVEFENIQMASDEISNAQELSDAAGMDQIQYFLNMAVETSDYTYFIRAYTAETDFYKRLNRLHAQTKLGYTEVDRNKWFIKFATVLKGNWHMRKYWWTGMCFRGIATLLKHHQIYKLEKLSKLMFNELNLKSRVSDSLTETRKVDDDMSSESDDYEYENKDDEDNDYNNSSDEDEDAAPDNEENVKRVQCIKTIFFWNMYQRYN
ncbi:unnamed protein product [Rotaria sp. Silwood1]|nr:unnamed protein product [Rotaria sp. Silwood1]CAF1283460.1 unnamed protein product [Rotaria sp. Silwood1]